MEIKDAALAAMADRASQITGLQLAIAADIEVARAHGASWADVGRALGITAQGAHKRYAPRSPGRIGPSTLPRES